MDGDTNYYEGFQVELLVVCFLLTNLGHKFYVLKVMDISSKFFG